MQKMTNFTPVELTRIFNSLKSTLSFSWNTGRGKKCTYTSMNGLFMTLTVYKAGGASVFLTSFFKIKSCTFQRIITKFVKIVTNVLYEKLVTRIANYFS